MAHSRGKGLSRWRFGDQRAVLFWVCFDAWCPFAAFQSSTPPAMPMRRASWHRRVSDSTSRLSPRWARSRSGMLSQEKNHRSSVASQWPRITMLIYDARSEPGRPALARRNHVAREVGRKSGCPSHLRGTISPRRCLRVVDSKCLGRCGKLLPMTSVDPLPKGNALDGAVQATGRAILSR